MLENWVGQLFALAGAPPALAGPAPGAARRGRRRALDQGRSQLPRLRQRAADPVHRDGVRDPARARRRGGAARAPGRRAPRAPVAFPIEVRFAAADDLILSASHARDTCYVAVHQDRRLDWRPYFREVEEIMDTYGGRPHWGKRHFQTAETLAPALPALGGVPGAARRELDPDGVFANEYVRRVLGSGREPW